MIVGIGVSVLSSFSIEAARMAIDGVRDTWRRIRESSDDNAPELPLIVAGGSNPALRLGFIAPRLIPWVFAEAWWYVLIAPLSVSWALSMILVTTAIWVIIVVTALIHLNFQPTKFNE